MAPGDMSLDREPWGRGGSPCGCAAVAKRPERPQTSQSAGSHFLCLSPLRASPAPRPAQSQSSWMNEPTGGWAGGGGEGCSQPAPELQAGLPHPPHPPPLRLRGQASPWAGAKLRRAGVGAGAWPYVRPHYLQAIRGQVRTRTRVSSGQRQEGQKKTLGGGPRGPFAERRGRSRDRESSRLCWGPTCVSYTENPSCPDRRDAPRPPSPGRAPGTTALPRRSPQKTTPSGHRAGLFLCAPAPLVEDTPKLH